MLGLFRKLMPREDKFFDLFKKHSLTIVGAAEALEALLQGGHDMERHCSTIVRLENEADLITQDVLLAVRRSFITPFDRGDIKDLIESMDDAIDTMNKTVKKIRLFEVTAFTPGMAEMGTLAAKASRLVAEAVPLLDRMGPNSERLSRISEEVVKLEGRSDEIHEQGLRSLYRPASGNADPMAYIVGAEIYGELEKVVDRFEDIANEISGIVIENV